MPETTKPAAHARESSFISLLSGWVQQGVENFFATQRILVDLAMRKNASAVDLVRGRLADFEFCSVDLAKEFAAEGLSNFIEGQKLLFNSAQKENEIFTTGVKEHLGGFAATAAMADAMRRSVDTFVDMQQKYLKNASKHLHGRLAAIKAGREYEGESVIDFAREALENFVIAQKKFLDVIAEETTKATTGRGSAARMTKTELTELAREAADSFFDVQKKLMDVANRQVHAGLKVTGRAMKLIPPIPHAAIPDLTREGVLSFVDAEKAVIDSITKKRTDTKTGAKMVRRVKRSHRPPRQPGRSPRSGGRLQPAFEA